MRMERRTTLVFGPIQSIPCNALKTNQARLYHVEMFLTMIAVKTITKGEEILNDYGPLPRSDLLRRYGYLSDDYKQWDVVEINTSEIIEAVTADLKLTSGEVDARACIACDSPCLSKIYH